MSDIVFALVETTKCKVVHVYEDEEKANEARDTYELYGAPHEAYKVQKTFRD